MFFVAAFRSAPFVHALSASPTLDGEAVRRAQEAQMRAQEVVARLGGNVDSLRAFPYANKRAYHFTFSRKGQKLFLKLPTLQGAEALAREIPLAKLAAEAGLAPSVVEGSESPFPFLVSVASGAALRAEDVRLPATRERVLALLTRVHALPAGKLAGSGPNVAATARTSCAEVDASSSRGSLVLPELRSWLEAQGEALARLPYRAVAVHADAWHENIVRDAENKLWLVDWASARLDDPLLDVARLLVLADVEFADERAWVQQTTGGHEIADWRRLQLLLGILEADYYCSLAKKSADVASKPSLKRLAQRLVERSRSTTGLSFATRL